MLAELVDHVIGVDPDRDWVTVAVVDAKTTGLVDTAQFPADRDGYSEAVAWADSYTTSGERAWAIEGTSSYGRGLTAALTGGDEWVIEFDRPHQKPAKDGAKSDALDAIRAARETVGRPKIATPRACEGPREAIRVHTVTRAAAVRAKTAAINELKALIVTAPESLRDELRAKRTPAIVKTCARFRDTPSREIAERCTRNSMRALAHRIGVLDTEIKAHDAVMKDLLNDAAPQLLAEFGIGHVTAALMFIAWSHPGRCRNEAAFARLGGVAPIPATSGQNQERHRLNPRGDRQLNMALYVVAMTRLRSHPETQGLPRETTRRRQNRPRNHPPPQALHRPPRLPTTREPNTLLTNIEESAGEQLWRLRAVTHGKTVTPSLHTRDRELPSVCNPGNPQVDSRRGGRPAGVGVGGRLSDRCKPGLFRIGRRLHRISDRWRRARTVDHRSDHDVRLGHGVPRRYRTGAARRGSGRSSLGAAALVRGHGPTTCRE